jgi:glucose/arabinose dehydrogenase
MKRPAVFFSILLISILTFSTSLTGYAATFNSATIPPALTFTTVVSGLNLPVFVANAGDGSNRLFIVQQSGQILIFKNNSLLATPFLNISSLSGFTGVNGEQGLLGLAFDPNFATNGNFYITYTTNTGNTNFPYTTTLARYHATPGSDVADTTGTVLLSAPKKWTNHNGGMLAFGADGYLYLSVGDGGSGGDPNNNAQNKSVLLGKILRLDVNSVPPSGQNYVIPPTNPFYSSTDTTIRKEIWAYGLRNSWRFSFDSLTHDLYIGDVGQDTQEEIDFQPASSTGGENYGWHILEGNLCYSPSSGCVAPTGYVAPVTTYNHGANDSFGCAVTGGYVYRGSASPALQGVYLYGDYCSGKILGLVNNGSGWTSKLITTTGYNISSFGQDEQGELYLTDYGAGQVVKISQVNLVTQNFVSQGILDGHIIETYPFSGSGGTIDSTSAFFKLGDSAGNRQYRAILSFATGSLPDAAVITSAQIKIKLTSISTTSPFSVLGKLWIDLGIPRFGTSTALESIDFQSTATKSGAGAVSPLPSSGWYTGSIYKANLPSINRYGATQIRLRFATSTNNNSISNFANFASGNAASSADYPQLIIQYYIP